MVRNRVARQAGRHVPAAVALAMPQGSSILKAMSPSVDRESSPARRPGSGAMVTVGAALVVTVLAAATGGGWSVTDRFGLWGQLGAHPTPPPPPPPPVVPRMPPRAGSAWPAAGLILAVAVAVAVVVLVAVVVWRSSPAWRERRAKSHRAAQDSSAATDHDREAARRTLRGGLDEALRLVAQLTDPTDAIVAAWLALEEAAAMIGAPRGPADTPTEFTAAVLAHTPADRIAVGMLLQLYHRARFSTGGVGADDLASARRCLRELAASWYRFDAAWSTQHGE